MPCKKKYQMASKMVDYKDSPYESEEKYGVGNSNLGATLRILKEEIMSYKEDNEIIKQSQETLVEANAIILHILSDLHQQGPL